ncbi:MAG TPA: hypothetical protein VF247_02255 [Candidatus Krumholzibacteria bacterium]
MRSTSRLALIAFFLAVSSCSDDSTAPPPPEETLHAGDITTWAGTGEAGFDGDRHSRLETQFYWPQDIEFTPTLGVYVTDWNNHRIRRLASDGTFRTVIGRDSDGDGPDDPAGVAGTACELNHPTQVFERSNGKLVVVCWHNHKLREWDRATNKITILVGRGPGCSGDGGSITSPTALLNQAPHAVEAADGSIYINDQRNQCIRKIDPAGMLSTVVSTPKCPTTTVFPPGGFSGDNGPPSAAEIAMPTGPNPNPPGGGLALDSEQRLYIADTNNHRIRRVDFGANVITTVVGNGVQGFGGDGGDPLQASLDTPLDITFGPDGRLYIADTYNNRIRAVDFTANVITTVAGNGTRGFSGDGGPATSAELAWPYGVGFNADGHLFIADTYNQRIRKVLMHD